MQPNQPTLFNNLEPAAQLKALKEFLAHPCYAHFIDQAEGSSIHEAGRMLSTVLETAPRPDTIYIREQMIGEVKGMRYVHDRVVNALDALNNKIAGKENDNARTAINADDTI